MNYKYEYTDYGSYGATVIKPEGAKYAGSITIPQTVEKNGIQYYVWYIGDEAFANCKDLKSVEFPRNFISIGNKAFYNCTGLTSIEINASTVYKSAFEGCSNLNSVVFQGTDMICARAFAGCSNLTSITIPEDLRMMGDDLGSDYNFGDNPGYVFDGCDNLSTVIINTEGFSTSERSILYSGPVFANLPNLKDFYCSSHKMPSIIWVSDGIYYSDFFKNTNIKNATLHVLPSLLEEFKKTAPWSGFGNIVGDMTDINGVKANPIFTDGTVYDLMGRKLKEPRKGINIINGKKVFVK